MSLELNIFTDYVSGHFITDTANNSETTSMANVLASPYGEPLSSRQQADGYSAGIFINKWSSFLDLGCLGRREG